MSCVRESSPQPENVNQRPEPKRRRFHPLRRLRHIFRRKAQSPEPCNEVKSCDEIVEPPILDTSKSRSTSELIDEPYTTRGRSLHSNLLSVSHDSVFNPEQHSGQSDSESAVSVPRLGFPQASIQAELEAAIRRRRKIQNDDDSDDVDEDLGLPRSPSMHSPTITTGNDLLLSKELITKSSHSTCSDGSLLSMGSSEMDEDSFGAHNSSRISLHDKRTSQTHLDSSDGDSSTSVPLSHSAAKHRMAIRPKRKHGNPRSKKPLTVTNALPATPEVNEEHSGRSASPETFQTVDATDGTTITSTATTSTTTATVTITTTITTNTTTINASDTAVDVSDACAAATDMAAITSTSRDLDTSVEEISVENVPRREEGFFHRLLSRRSVKKKTAAVKSTSAEDVDVDRFLFDETIGAKPRQREEPPPVGRMQLSYPTDLPPDHLPQQQLHQRGIVPLAEDLFESDTFVPIKQSFSLEQYVAPINSSTTNTTATTTDDDATSSGGGSSVLKSSSSDSVSSAALDEPGFCVGVDSTPAVVERCRAYSSSDSSADNHHVNNQQGSFSMAAPIPAPRPSKLYNGAAVDVVVRRKKRDDQQPELLKVFARRSLKLGKDGEPELLLLADGEEEHNEYNGAAEEAAVVPVENKVIVVLVDGGNKRGSGKGEPEVDVNENQTVAATVEMAEVVPRFKRIQQRREEWEKRLLQQQQN